MEIINYKWVGKANNHLNITLKYKDSFLNAIGFNFDSYRNIIKKKQKIDIVYTADTNKWNGKTYTNLYMKDIKLPQKTLSSSLNTLIEYSNSLVLADTEIDRIKSQMGLESSSTKIIDKRNIPNRVEYIKKILPSSGKTLIIVNNYIYGWALMDQLINRSPYNIGVFIQGYGHYIKSDRQILYVAPILEKNLIEKHFSDVIIYDMFFSTALFKKYLKETKATNTHILFNRKDYKLNHFVMRGFYPDREMLANIYLYIKKNCVANRTMIIKTSLPKLKKEIKISRNIYIHLQGISNSLEILDELGIIKYNQKENKMITIELLPINGKVNLKNSTKYIKSLKMLEQLKLSSESQKQL